MVTIKISFGEMESVFNMLVFSANDKFIEKPFITM